MSVTLPELKAILEQVEAELAAMLLSGADGTLTVHVGRGDMAVEVMTKHRREPVRIERNKRLNVIR